MEKLISELKALLFTCITTEHGPTLQELASSGSTLESIQNLYHNQGECLNLTRQEMEQADQLLQKECEEHVKTQRLLEAGAEKLYHEDRKSSQALTDEREEHHHSNRLWMHANDEVREELRNAEAQVLRRGQQRDNADKLLTEVREELRHEFVKRVEACEELNIQRDRHNVTRTDLVMEREEHSKTKRLLEEAEKDAAELCEELHNEKASTLGAKLLLCKEHEDHSKTRRLLEETEEEGDRLRADILELGRAHSKLVHEEKRWYVVIFKDRETRKFVRIGHFSERFPTSNFDTFCINATDSVDMATAETMCNNISRIFDIPVHR